MNIFKHFCHLRTCLRLLILCIVLLMMLYIIIYNSHHLTCYIHPNFCVPWTNWLKQLPKVPEMMTEEEFNIAAYQMWEQNENDQNMTRKSVCRRIGSEFVHPCQDKVIFILVLGQRHGGTNWMMGEFNTFRHFWVRGWEYQKCSRFSTTFEGTQCDEQSLVNALDDIYNGVMGRHPTVCKYKTPYYFLWKVQIEQIPPYLFRVFVDYIYCQEITVIHFIRQATVASFWSFQAKVIERLYTMNPNKILHAPGGDLDDMDADDKHVGALTLDPAATLDFVQKMENNRMMLSKLIKLYPKRIKYKRFDYEDLIGPKYSELYWNALKEWIKETEFEYVEAGYQRRGAQRKQMREHPMSCFTKIMNWNSEIKEILAGTDSYYACEKYAS